MFSLILLLVWYTVLKVPDTGISSHLRIYLFTAESMFSEIQVFDKAATVKCQENLDKR